MTITLGIATLETARHELRTLMGCTEILGNLGLDIDRASTESDEGGQLQNWRDALQVVNQALYQAAENLSSAIRLDEARATPTNAAAE